MKKYSIVALAFLVLSGFASTPEYYNLCTTEPAKPGECSTIITEKGSHTFIETINGQEVKYGEVIVDVPPGTVTIMPHYQDSKYSSVRSTFVSYPVQPGHKYVFYGVRGKITEGDERLGTAEGALYYYLRDFDTNEIITSTLVNKTSADLMADGLDFRDKGDLENALRCFNEALALDPNAPTIYHQRGKTYFLLGKYDEAVSDLTKGI
jgi:tetratricopeptide (TPR) repeat protein